MTEVRPHVPALPLAPGVLHYKSFLDRAAQESLLADIRTVVALAPLFQPVMPKTGKAFSVQMSNCGPLGWVSDLAGYRYQPNHPVSGALWPEMPEAVLAIWRALAQWPQDPQACLINFYEPAARMGPHQDADETSPAPIVSISLGDSCRFRFGGNLRRDKTRSILLESGDVLTFGGPARKMFHGVDRILPQTSTLMAKPGRINLTLRRVD
jgi:alkylated DNA repair protein (DNA oxidative demethylase)